MTEEGIVQKVIRKWLSNYKNCSCDFCKLVEPESIELEQELIEAIKQEFIGSSAIYTYVVRRKLIGDSQE